MTERKEISVADERLKKIEELEEKLKIAESHFNFDRKHAELRTRIKEKYSKNGIRSEIPLGVPKSMQMLVEGKDLFASHYIAIRSMARLLKEQAKLEIKYKFNLFVREGARLDDFSKCSDLFELLPIFISQDFSGYSFQYFEPVYVDRLFSFERKLSLIGMECEESVFEKKEFFPDTQYNQYVIWVCARSFFITHATTLEKVRQNLVDERFLYIFEIPQFYLKFKDELRENVQYVFAGVLSRTDTYPVLIIENGKPRIRDGMIPGMEAVFPVAGKTQMK